MKNIHLDSDFQYTDELQKIVNLIREYVTPAKIVLAGKYAGMPLASVLGGYELLVVMEEYPPRRSSDIERYVNQHFPPSERDEKQLFVYAVAAKDIVDKNHSNYYYQQVHEAGVLLHDDSPYLLWQGNSLRFSKILKKNALITEKHMDLGDIFLQDAEKAFRRGSLRAACFYVYHAVQQHLQAAALIYYGFEIVEENILCSSYSLARHTSPRLAELWDLNTLKGRFSLLKLHNLNRHSRETDNFSIPDEKVAKYIKTAQLISEEAKQVYRQRMEILQGLIPKEMHFRE